MKREKRSEITRDMSGLVVTNSQASCSLIHLNPSQEPGPARAQTALSEPGIVNHVTWKAKSLHIFIPTNDFTS